MLGKEVSSTIFKSLVWRDLVLDISLRAIGDTITKLSLVYIYIYTYIRGGDGTSATRARHDQ